MKRGTQTATFMASAMALAASGMERDRARLAPKAPKEREPLAATPQDRRNVRQMVDALSRYSADSADAWSIAAALRMHGVQNCGTRGSWLKRLRRLAVLGWAKQGKDGTWSLTAAGKKEVAR